MAWLRASLLRLRDERLTALGLVAIVLVTAFLAAAAPRLFDRAADTTLESSLREARSGDRNIQFLRQSRFDPVGDDLFARVSGEADRLHGLLPPLAASFVAEQAWTMDSGRFRVANVGDDEHITMRLRVQPDTIDRIHLVTGRLPTATTDEVSNPLPVAAPAFLTRFEVALPTASAAILSAEIGDTVILTSDSTDTMVGRGHELAIAAQVVGIYDVDDPDDPWWLGTTEVEKPSIRTIGDTLIYDTTALLAPEAYPAWMDETRELLMPSRYTFREYVDVSRIDSSDVTPLANELKRLEAAYPSTSVTVNQDLALRTGLRALLERYRSQWSAATAILTMAAIGPAAVAAGAMGLVTVLAAKRRRAALALSRGRGASIGQVVAAVIAEGLVLGLPAAAAAIAAAIVLVPADPLLASIGAGLLVAAVAIGLLAIATVPATGGPSFGPVREAFIPRRPTSRRLLFEALVVGVAIAGAVLLRQRGVRGASSTGGLGEADPLLAAVPALIGIAAGLLVVRLLPYPMRLLAAIARRGRGLVPVLAMRRATQGGGVAPVLIVLLATAAIGAFSSAILVHLDRAAEVVAWGEVGADYRIDARAGGIRGDFDPMSLPDVEAAASQWSGIVTMGGRNLRIEFIVLATIDYDKVVAGTPANPGLPLDLYATAPDVIPLLASRQLVERADGLPVGTELTSTIQGFSFPSRIVAGHDEIPAIASDSLWVIASREQLKAMFPQLPLNPTVVFLRAPVGSEAAIRAAVDDVFGIGATLTSRAAATAALRSAPVSTTIQAGIAAAAIIALVYAALAVAASLALAGAARAVEVAHLRSMGLTGRQAAGLVIVEHGPTVALAFLLGTALGLGIFLGIRDGLGLDLLVQSRVAIPITVQPTQLLLVLGAIIAVVGGGLAIGTLMQRGAVPVAALRRGFE